MAPPAEPEEDGYKTLLKPIKDVENSFRIDIGLLEDYLRDFMFNFNEAGLYVQASASIYGKKVDCVHMKTTALLQTLVKNHKDEQAKKVRKEREKQNKDHLDDPFFSIAIKPGKNLSALRQINKRSVVKSLPKKGSKKQPSAKGFSFVPVDLLPLEEDKGDPFYDTRGDLIGNVLDYVLNKCRVTSEGWILLPTVSPDLITLQSTFPSFHTIEPSPNTENGVCHDTSDVPHPSPSPDEGYPASTGGSAASMPFNSEKQSQGTDEGLGSLPCTPMEGPSLETPGSSQTEGPSQPTDDQMDSESPDAPMDGADESPDMALKEIDNLPLDFEPSATVRRSMRLRQSDAPENASAEGQENVEDAHDEIFAVRKAIQKKNTAKLPKRLGKIYPASEFCARTFFALNKKQTELGFSITAFAVNSKMAHRVEEMKVMLIRKKDSTHKLPEDQLHEDYVDIRRDDSDEESPDADMPCPILEDIDIVIDHNSEPLVPQVPHDIATAEEPPIENEMDPLNESSYDYNLEAREQFRIFHENLQLHDQSADIAERVHAWELYVRPFLQELEKREPFDINQYGASIIDAFPNTNRKITMRFKQFCKGMPKWKIHRYFMAVLPLVNVGNVSIRKEVKENGKEDILVTLLSRKMHHEELKEFGHSIGEHD